MSDDKVDEKPSNDDPRRPTWIPDGWVSKCTTCKASFTMTKRKHHCSNIFCRDCSTNALALPELGYDMSVRVCDNCYRKYNELQQENTQGT